MYSNSIISISFNQVLYNEVLFDLDLENVFCLLSIY